MLNEAWDAVGLDWRSPPAPSDPAAVAAWARFVAACAQQGVSVGDPRWQRLEVRRRNGRPRFRLPNRDGREPFTPDAKDFRVGLALLVSLLGRELEDDE